MTQPREQVIDAMLVLRCQSGDAAAFDLLAQRWQQRLQAHAMRLLGEATAAADAVQESWVAIARGIRRLDDPDRFAPWAYRIVRNKCTDRIRRASRERARDVPLEADLGDAGAAAAETETDAGEHAALVRQLRLAVRELPSDQRTLLTLFYFEGLGVNAIAEVMDIPAGTVKSRLFHLRARLRKTMEE